MPPMRRLLTPQPDTDPRVWSGLVLKEHDAGNDTVGFAPIPTVSDRRHRVTVALSTLAQLGY